MSDHQVIVHHVRPLAWPSGDSAVSSRDEIVRLLGATDKFLERRVLWTFLPGQVASDNASWQAVASAVQTRRDINVGPQIHVAFVDGPSGARGYGDIVNDGADPTTGNRLMMIFKPAGWVPGVIAHELFHTLGAVHPQAPSADHSASRHSYGWPNDLMFYGGGVDGRVVLDEQGDSYYNPSPVPGGWLSKNPKFNIYYSPFLAPKDSPLPPPTPPPVDKPRFSDIESHPLRPHIERMAKAGIIHGYPDGTFRPQANPTRAQIATMFSRFLDHINQGENA